MTLAAWVGVVLLGSGPPAGGREASAAVPFDRRLIDAVLAGSEEAARLVLERPADAFDIFHGYLDAAIAQEIAGDARRSAFGWDFAAKLAVIHDGVVAGAFLGQALERYRSIRVEHIREKVEADRRLRDFSGLLRAKEAERAAREAEAAIDLCKKAGDSRGEARALHSLATAREEAREWASVEASLDEAARLFALVGDRRGRAQALARKGNFLQRRGRYPTALGAYREAGSLFAAIGEREESIRMRSDEGTILASIGRPREALPLIEEARLFFRSRGDRVAEAHAASQTAMALLAAGDFADAMRCFLEAVALLGEGPEHIEHRARALLQLGEAYAELKLSDRGRERIEEALRLVEGRGADDVAGRALASLGLIAYETGDLARAEELTRRALSAGDGDVAARGWRLHSLASILAARGDPSAMQIFGEARDAFAESGSVLGEGLCAAARADLALRGGRYSEAEQGFRMALEASPGFPEVAWRARTGLGEIFESRGELLRAIAEYGEAIALLEDLLRGSRVASLSIGFFEGRDRPFLRLSALLARLDRAEEALIVAERLQARSLAEDVRPARPRAAAKLSAPLRARREALEMRREDLNRRREESALGSADLSRLEADRGALAREYEDLLVSIDLEAPREAEVLQPFRPVEARALQEALRRNGRTSAALVYLTTPERVHLWTITGAICRHRALAVGEEELRRRVDALRRPFSEFRGGLVDLSHVEFDIEAARDLHRILVAPAAEDLAGIERVSIVADGPLHHVPFEALVIGGERGAIDHRVLFAEYRGLQYLVERWEISYAPSLRALVRPPPPSGARAEALVLADPAASGLPPAPGQLRGSRRGALPQAGAEAEAIARTLGSGRVSVLLGSEASEAELRRRIAGAGLVHIAAHSWVEERAPLFSAIQLAAGSGDDGLLEAHEVLEMDFRGKLVVLSGCETALGPLRRGEGLESLARVFLMAGAEGVVGSLWRVDDSTSRLMERFYAGLAEGKPPARALRAAKIDLLRRREGPGFAYALPFFWAPFILVGGAD